MKFLYTTGFKVFLLYIFFTYIPQIYFHYEFANYFRIHYQSSQYEPFIVLLFIAIFIFFVIIFYSMLPKKIFSKKRKYFSNKSLRILKIFSLLVSILFVVSSFIFIIKYDIDFRSVHRLNQTGIFVKLLVFLQAYVVIEIFFILTKILRGEQKDYIDKLKLILIFIGWILSNTHSLGVPLLLIILILLFMKDFTIRNILIYKISKFQYLIFFTIGFLFIIGAIFLGFANKIGTEATLELFNIDNIHILFEKVFGRLSTSFSVLNTLIHKHFLDLDLQLNGLYNLYYTFINRIYMLLHLGYNHDIHTVNRDNFFILFTPLHYHLEFAGASPGLLATIFYTPLLFPFNIFIIAFYTAFIIKLMNIYIPYRLNLIGIFIILYFMYRFFEGPLDYFYIIEPTFLFVNLFILGIFTIKQVNNYVVK